MDLSHRKKWKYKAEGNKHVVVSDGQGSCLRLLKLESSHCHFTPHNEISFSESESDSNMNCNENQDELLFIEYVVLPLINYCDAWQVPKVIKMPQVFLHDLAQQIQFDRPKYRHHQSLDCKSSCLHMKDYCFIQQTQHFDNFIKHGMTVDPNIITVEIKLKNGFVKGYDLCTNGAVKPVCQFCKTQVFKKLEKGSKLRCSSYCPLDLFSGDKNQMKKALYSLLLTPQNNLRIFKNGDLIFSQETANSVKSKFYNEFKRIKTELDCTTLLKQLFCNFPNSSKLDPKLLVDLVCKSLLIPIAAKNSLSDLPRIEKCYGSYFKKLLCEDVIELNYFESNDPQSSENIARLLPTNSILGIVLSQQNLDTHSFSDIFKKSQNLDLFLADHCVFKDELSLEAPYNSIGWKNFSSDPLKPRKSDIFEDMYHVSHQLKQFFVAKSFNDCSVMISFQKVYLPESAINYVQDQTFYSAKFNLIKDFDGNYFVASIAVVDTDPKYTANLPVYMKKYAEISEWWSKKLPILISSGYTSS